MKYQRMEYPRPQFRRSEWLPLNGEWEFCFDDAGEKIKKGYEAGNAKFPLKINVPFTYQYEASGIGDKSLHETVWYKRTFTAEVKAGRRALLNFNASDFVTDVWVNGKHAVTHRGGFTPFFADVTDLLKAGENVLVVRCYDPFDPAIPRGKQSWTGEKFGCWYIPNTSIWQSVWLEYCGEDCVSAFALTPDYDNCAFYGEITTLYAKADEAEFEVFYKGNRIKKMRFSLDGKRTRYCVKMEEMNFVDADYAWTPDNPVLFEVNLSLYCNGKTVDGAKTRFGLRKVSSEGRHLLLNNAPIYERLILDQGYWEESGLTPPSAEALKKDIELSLAMGFNGARKHQKFEDPYFYYYAEELGFLTWCEMPSAYRFGYEEQEYISCEWREIVEAAKNFTSIVCYVPLNESWGVRNLVVDGAQQNFARSLYYATKAQDPTRLISTNDGWENSDVTDIISAHDYSKLGEGFAEKYCLEGLDDLFHSSRRLMQFGCKTQGQPVVFTEFGGIAMADDSKDGNWGYNRGASNEEEFFERYASLMKGISESGFCGFCYTQLTDVQQEVNGLLRPDRTPKFDMKRLKDLTEIKD